MKILKRRAADNTTLKMIDLDVRLLKKITAATTRKQKVSKKATLFGYG
jgi:hypothetical protein